MAQQVKGLALSLSWLVVRVQSLAQELLYVVGATLHQKKKKKKRLTSPVIRHRHHEVCF